MHGGTLRRVCRETIAEKSLFVAPNEARTL
jgi:hypothetical protein